MNWHWEHTVGFIRGIVASLLVGGLFWFYFVFDTSTKKPDWVLPLSESITMTKKAAETHAYAIEWMKLNPDADWHNFGSIERQEYWELLHNSSAWYMSNR